RTVRGPVSHSLDPVSPGAVSEDAPRRFSVMQVSFPAGEASVEVRPPASAREPPPDTAGGGTGAPAPPRLRASGMAPPAAPATAAFVAGAAVLARYHRHRVFHLARLGRLIREGRRVILVGNHALDVVDPLLFVAAVRARYGRVPRFMAHALWFRLPVLRDLA